MKKKVISLLASIILIAAAILHLTRSIMGWELLIEGWELPMWVSWIAVVIAGGVGIQELRKAVK